MTPDSDGPTTFPPAGAQFVFAAIGIGGTVLWIWMLVECAAYEPDKAGNDKLMWILIIVLTGMIGALIYMIVRRPKRKLEVGK